MLVTDLAGPLPISVHRLFFCYRNDLVLAAAKSPAIPVLMIGNGRGAIAHIYFLHAQAKRAANEDNSNKL